MTPNNTIDVDEITVSNDSTVMIRLKISSVDADGNVNTSLHRKPIYPGQDYSKEEEMVQDVCKSTHTPEVIEAYNAAMTAKGA